MLSATEQNEFLGITLKLLRGRSENFAGAMEGKKIDSNVICKCWLFDIM